MPNPLIRLGRQNTGKKPQEHFAFGNTNMPDAPPEVEHYVGNNHPYRGTEIHGVEDTVDAKDVVVDYQATQEGITYLKPPEDVEPLPVRIVEEHGREILQWRGRSHFLTQNQSLQVAPRNEARKEIRLINISVADNIWIAHYPINPQGVAILFKLTPSMLFVTMPTQMEVYALTDAAAGSFIQTIEIFSVEE